MDYFENKENESHNLGSSKFKVQKSYHDSSSFNHYKQSEDLEIDSKYINGNSLYKEPHWDFKAGGSFLIDDLIGESVEH